MNRKLKIVAIVVAVLILIVIAIPFFIDANAFRPRLETELTEVLGRQVKVGDLSLSVQAKSLKVGVEMIPLIFFQDPERDQPNAKRARDQPGEIGEQREVEFLQSGRKQIGAENRD